jgi:hypothetical protein
MDENCRRDRLLSDAAKWLRLIVPGEQRGFYKFKARGQNKFLFQILLPRSVVKIATRICENCEIPQGNGNETTSTGIAPPGSSESASNFVAALLNPRFTYASAISFPSRVLRVVLVIQPASFPDAEGATSFIPRWSGVSLSEINPHNRLLVCPDIFIREITSWPM